MRGQEPETHTCFVSTSMLLSQRQDFPVLRQGEQLVTPWVRRPYAASCLILHRALSEKGTISPREPQLRIQGGHFCHRSLINSESWAAEMPTVTLTSAISSSIFGVYDQAPLYFCLCKEISLSHKKKKVKIFFFMDYKTSSFSFWVKR